MVSPRPARSSGERSDVSTRQSDVTASEEELNKEKKRRDVETMLKRLKERKRGVVEPPAELAATYPPPAPQRRHTTMFRRTTQSLIERRRSTRHSLSQNAIVENALVEVETNSNAGRRLTKEISFSQIRWQSSAKMLTNTGAALSGMKKGQKALRRQATLRAFMTPKSSASDSEVAAWVRREQMLKKFRHAVRMILILKKWSFEIAKTIDANRLLGKYTTFTDLAMEAAEAQNSETTSLDLGFDVKYYKAKKELTLSSEVKDILALPPKLRTNEQIMTVIYGIRNHPSFAEYPHHMQEKLCQVARYEMVPAQRVIIRQGHYAQNFYFIISGQAVVKVMDSNPLSGEESVRTAAILKDGGSFGEIALLHHTRRTATVVSRDVIHLLTIGREDFFDIFMGEMDTAENPVHIQFLQGMAFMKGWPIEKLIKHKDHCIMHYFKRGRVIVEDSQDSEWIYVIKSGSCRVIKHMKEAVPERVWRRKVRVDRSKDLPRPGTGEQSPRIDDGRKTRIQSSRCQTRSPWTFTEMAALPDAGATPTPGQPARPRQFLNRSETIMALPRIVPPSNQASIPGMTSSRYPSGHDVTNAKSDVTVGGGKGAGYSESRLDSLLSGRGAESPGKVTSPTVSFAKDNSFVSLDLPRLTPHSPRDSPGSGSTPRSPREADFYLQVQILKSGDTFGMADLQFDEDVDPSGPSMSLVSLGAEIIMLKKQFFITYADEEVKEHLRRCCQEYPPETVIRNNLKIKLNWDTYRGTVMQNVLEKQQEMQLLRQRTKVNGL